MQEFPFGESTLHKGFLFVRCTAVQRRCYQDQCTRHDCWHPWCRLKPRHCRLRSNTLSSKHRPINKNLAAITAIPTSLHWASHQHCQQETEGSGASAWGSSSAWLIRWDLGKIWPYVRFGFKSANAGWDHAICSRPRSKGQQYNSVGPERPCWNAQGGWETTPPGVAS